MFDTWAGRVTAVAVILATTLLAQAQPRSPWTELHAPQRVEAPDANPGPRCAPKSSLERLACQLAEQIAKTPGPPPSTRKLIVTRPVQGAPGAAGARALGAGLSEALAAALAATSGGSADSLDVARRGLGPGQILIWIEPTLLETRLLATAAVITTDASFWERLKAPVRAPVPAGRAEVAIDAAISGFFPRVPLGVHEVVRTRLPIPEALALACADLDGDGTLEVALAGRHQLVIGQLADEHFEPLQRVNWSAHTQVAPNPLRQPLLTLSAGPWGLDAGSTDRARLLRLGENLAVKSTSEGLHPWPGLGCTRRSGLGLLPGLETCGEGEALDPVRQALGKAMLARLTQHLGKAPTDLDAIAGFAPKHGPQAVLAARAVSNATLVVVGDSGDSAATGPSGAAIALGDLDHDGTPELLHSLDTLVPSQDGLRALSFAGGALHLRFELAVQSGVAALAICPAQGLRQASSLLATRTELWELR